MDRINILDLSLEEIEALIARLGKERYRARQIMKWLYSGGVQSFEEMTTLSRKFRNQMEELAFIGLPQIEKVQVSNDGTKKILFRLEDDLFIESVLIPGKNHWTACISTQVGCRMGCRFCLTARQGFRRNLKPSEITGQMTKILFSLPEGPNVRSIVLMGMGEPLANYKNTLKAIGILTSDYGFGFSNRKITLSTSGVVPMIQQLGRDICINLAVSLNAPDNAIRNQLMPVNRKYPVEDLLKACRDYPMPGRRMLTFEYILIDGINATPAHAERLCRLLKGIRCKLNLIRFNEFPGSPFQSPSEDTVLAFQQILVKNHYTAIIRASRGRDILAACGQLSGKALEENLSKCSV
ncbi:23S rRNA m(2)A-2503 methyltransferase [Syntrophus gentianae]|uniref:Probable dual-specificity RNA methyltransferase RlmN n=1 Tax=Syntrophus gentianae TaxID=43775 RepID=A0A1H7WQY0_9BACT|nr:23S rRNA (adenine(2503)-C(2))-methyltransferase RlmN [Syntrophus gentianae]SEM23841.1 23S rRNA m(2)A-2503 methyltransferase [Syntrophus gentianae]